MADRNQDRGFTGDERDRDIEAKEGRAAAPATQSGRAGARATGGRAATTRTGGVTGGTQQDNETLVRAVYDAYNDRAFDRVRDLVTDDVELVNVAFGETFRGPEGQRQFMENWAAAFPDSRIEVTKVIDGGDSVVVEFTGRGTHTGPLRAPAGEIAPTRKRVEVKFCEVHEVENGKIARGRSYFDSATMLRQLGLIT